jgi:protein associated with RNAse G/E
VGSGKPGWLEIKWYTTVLVYADDVNILGGNIHTIKKNTETLVVASNGLV